VNGLPIKEANRLALEVGRILLQSGATTNRVELMMTKVCRSFGYGSTECFVTPTGIFITVSDGENQLVTSIKRIESRRIDLGKITEISHLVQKLERINKDITTQNMSPRQLVEALQRIDSAKPWPQWLQILTGGTSAGFFCLLFGGSWPEFAVAIAVGLLVSISTLWIASLSINNFLLNVISAALVVLFAQVLDIFVPYIKLDNIIIGGIMLLVPGLAIVNAIRDTMSGDLVSGTARAVEAIFIAVAIAVGSGTMMKLWALMGY
jgi:uncharacterized membrane protein YjjP (DUF1212 family)